MAENQKTILKIAVDCPLPFALDYFMPASWTKLPLPGARIKVPFRNKNRIGILLNLTTVVTIDTNKIKEALECLDDEPLIDENILELVRFAADYYHYPIGQAVAAVLPPYLRSGKKNPLHSGSFKTLTDTLAPAVKHPLNEEQKHAVETVIHSLQNFQVFLLDGITGSGKTEVYLNVLETVLKQNRQALVLVPEISLTPQTIARFQGHFPEKHIVAFHSNMTPKKRALAFLHAQAGTADIVIGTRSAVFTSIARLGLIILDEEHDTSFKQQDGFRYHARDIAVMRASKLQIPVLLGSATPSLESFANVARGKFTALHLTKRANQANLPGIEVIDLLTAKCHNGLSEPLIAQIKQTLAAQNQVLLFINRRGFAMALYCNACGYRAQCSRCDAKLIYHKKKNLLICHHCLYQTRPFQICPECKLTSLLPLSFGTERIELTLKEIFKNTEILRIDSDSIHTAKDWEQTLDLIHTGKPCLLIGTQMLAKGHHFPRVALVGILDCDYGFHSTDLRALERMGQLILQVAGRAGRAQVAGKVLLQTREVNHPLLAPLLKHDYQQFAKLLLAQREANQLPPFSFHALLHVEAKQSSLIKNFFVTLLPYCQQLSGIDILGPIEAMLAKRAGFYREQLLFQAKSRPGLQNFLKKLLRMIYDIKSSNQVRWHLDVDPMDFY